MATLRSYTNINQSKVLATILPLESADYTRLGENEDNVLTRSYFESCSSELKELVGKDEIYPCWSIASLLSVLPLPDLAQDKADDELFWRCSVYREDGELLCETYDNNPIDACYELILSLNKLNLL